MIKPILFVVNGQNLISFSGLTILMSLKIVGINFARFCFHEHLPIAGNCRACLVETENFEKPIPACVADLENGQIIWPESLFTQKCKENIFESLLANHPLDCPICDQAGECDLQDQAKVFGGDRSRFFLNKRGVFDKNCDFLVKAIMVRCIHCTRCIRFNNTLEFSRLGILLRGSASAIGNYFFKPTKSNLFGNVIDLCPVGALTARIQAFSVRPWEVKSQAGIDLLDGFGSNIYFHVKDQQVLKITPKPNKSLNGYIINDNCRFSMNTSKDLSASLFINGLFWDKPRPKNVYIPGFKFLIKYKKQLSWFKFFTRMDEYIQHKKIIFLINENLSFNHLQFIKSLSNRFSSKTKILITRKISINNLVIYASNSLQINKASVFVFLATNLKLESAILNFKLSTKYTKTLLSIFCLGQGFTSNLKLNFCGLNTKHIIKLLEGKNLLATKIKFFLNLIFLCGKSLNIHLESFHFFVAKLKKVQIITINLFCNERGLNFLGLKRRCITKKSIVKKISNFPIGNDRYKDRTVIFPDLTFCLNSANSLSLRKFVKRSFQKILWFNNLRPSKLDVVAIIPTAATISETGIYLSQQKLQLSRKILFSKVKTHNLSRILSSIFKFHKLRFNNLTLFLDNLKPITNSFYFLSVFFLEKKKVKVKVLKSERKIGWEVN